MIFKIGFVYKDFKFGLKNQKLYRLPTIKNGKEYSMREVPVIWITSKIRGYRIVRDKKSLKQIEQMVESISIRVKYNDCKDCLKDAS